MLEWVSLLKKVDVLTKYTPLEKVFLKKMKKRNSAKSVSPV